jgi:hypothetical protein
MHYIETSGQEPEAIPTPSALDGQDIPLSEITQALLSLPEPDSPEAQ